MDDVIDLNSRRVHRRPSAGHRASRQRLQDAASVHEALDALVHASKRASTLELLHIQRDEVAREAAALKFDRIFGNGKVDAGRLISRRIRALRAIADASIQLYALEFNSPSPVVIRRVVELLKDEIIGAAQDIFDEATAGRFEAAVHQRLSTAAFKDGLQP